MLIISKTYVLQFLSEKYECNDNRRKSMEFREGFVDEARAMLNKLAKSIISLQDLKFDQAKMARKEKTDNGIKQKR